MRHLIVSVIFHFASVSASFADNSAIAFLENRVERDPDDFIAWNQLAERYHVELRLTGDDTFIERELQAAQKSLDAMPAAQNPDGLAALAQAQLTAHRFKEAQASALQLHEISSAKIRSLELLADTSMELGNYEKAREAVEELAIIEGTELSSEPRFAKLAIIEGKLDQAREHYQKGLAHSVNRAATEPENVAWFHLQLGALAFKQGDWDAAEKHYTEAGKTWPEGYAFEDYLAELRGAQGRTAVAIALYEKLAARVPRPEFFQALGDLVMLAGDTEKAAEWHARAEAAYMKSVEKGAVHFYHHIAGFYADSKVDAAKAVEWARKDLELRSSIHAHDALAWALYKNDEVGEASAEIEKVIATGTRDPHLLYHAGLIRMATGDIAGGKKAIQQAAEVNPRFNTFHVHR
jgi:tetratricopeptide (TPR) repeat protein